MAVPVVGRGTVSVEAVKAPPVQGMQKPPSRVRKRVQDRLLVAPGKKKVKKPAGLKTRPAWLREDRLGMNPAVCRGVTGCQAWHLLSPVQALRRLTGTTSSRDLNRMVREWGPPRRTT